MIIYRSDIKAHAAHTSQFLETIKQMYEDRQEFELCAVIRDRIKQLNETSTDNFRRIKRVAKIIFDTCLECGILNFSIKSLYCSSALGANQ